MGLTKYTKKSHCVDLTVCSLLAANTMEQPLHFHVFIYYEDDDKKKKNVL